MKNKKILKLFITTLIVIGTGTSFFRMNEIKAEESNLSVKCVDQKNILQNNIKVNLIKEELIMWYKKCVIMYINISRLFFVRDHSDHSIFKNR